MTTTPTACLLIIGNEILSGRTRDANMQFIGQRLAARGIKLREARVLCDDEAVIVPALNEVRARHTYVFTTGGIGPTHDDITSPCVARAFGVAWIKHPEAMALMEKQYPPGEFNEARQRMATVPEGAVLIPNRISAAPGFRMDNVYVLAGVPKIMQAMFAEIEGELARGPALLSAAVTVYAGEGRMAAPLAAIQAAFPDLDIGSYPFADRIGAAIVARGTDQTRLDAAAEAVRRMAAALGAAIEEGDRVAALDPT